MVFDGSAMSTNGKASNEFLAVGPILQNDLFMILWRFRLFVAAVVCEMVQMYRQVVVDPEDRKDQGILWSIGSDDPTCYVLSTVTYGTASASFLAVTSVFELAAVSTEQGCQHYGFFRRSTEFRK